MDTTSIDITATTALGVDSLVVNFVANNNLNVKANQDMTITSGLNKYFKVNSDNGGVTYTTDTNDITMQSATVQFLTTAANNVIDFDANDEITVDSFEDRPISITVRVIMIAWGRSLLMRAPS